MAVAFSRYVDGTASSGSTTAVVNLSACSVGDLAFVLISRSSTTAASAVPNAGWQLLDAHSSTYRIMLYWKSLVAADLASLTWTFGTNSVRTLCKAFVWTGATNSTPSYTKGTFGTGSAQTLNLGNLTSSQAWMAVFAACYSTASKTYDISSWSSPSWSERRDHGTTTPDWWQLAADTNGGWGGGNFAPSTSTLYISAVATYRGGFIVELKAMATPTVTNVAPNSGTENQSKAVVITGTDFIGATAVTVGGHNASSFTVDSITQISATLPSHAAEADLQVQVTTPIGSSADTAADNFSYVVAPVSRGRNPLLVVPTPIPSTGSFITGGW